MISPARLPRLRVVSAETPDDSELLRRLAAGDLSSLGVLYDRHEPSVRRVVLRSVASRADADDVVHEVFLRLARVASTFDGREDARPFILGVANCVLRERRRALARWGRALAALAASLRGVVTRTPEQTTAESETHRELTRAIAMLTEEKRVVFLMCEREGMTGEEIAKELDIPIGTVWTRLHHARIEVRRALTRKGVL
jgi:RNA polymerase sigma-70 factor (ECF subfamily)